MTKDIQKRLFGPCGSFEKKTDDVKVDFNALIRRFLLFDTYIIDSIRFLEFRHLIEFFGFDWIIEFLKSGGIRINSYAMSIGQVKQSYEIKTISNNKLAIFGPFAFELIKEFEKKRKENICLHFKNSIHSINSLSLKEKIKLKQNIISVLETPPSNFGEETINNFRETLIPKSSLVETAIIKRIEEVYGKVNTNLNLFVKLHRISEKDFEIETNIGHRLGIEETMLNNIIHRAILSLNDNYRKIEEMKTFNALSTFWESELPSYQQSVNFLMKTLSSKKQEDRFMRVVKIKGFPDINNADTKIDISKLLKIRNSKECQEFRNWLNTIDKDSDIELLDRLEGFRARMCECFNSTMGQTIRFLFYSGLGFVPSSGNLTGLALSALDHFLLSKILSNSGPISFINKGLSSIYK